MLRGEHDARRHADHRMFVWPKQKFFCPPLRSSCFCSELRAPHRVTSLGSCVCVGQMKLRSSIFFNTLACFVNVSKPGSSIRPGSASSAPVFVSRQIRANEAHRTVSVNRDLLRGCINSAPVPRNVVGLQHEVLRFAVQPPP